LPQRTQRATEKKEKMFFDRINWIKTGLKTLKKDKKIKR